MGNEKFFPDCLVYIYVPLRFVVCDAALLTEKRIEITKTEGWKPVL
jgi:hypothetical protein